MALNSLAAVQTNPRIENMKQIAQFLNYRATHPDAVTEYIRSGMVLHIYLDASYMTGSSQICPLFLRSISFKGTTERAR